jgi:5'-3' exoribonuclease 2
MYIYINTKAPVNLERVIDDFVFMTFLVGNDFLPHLPSLDISEGAFDRLFNTYKSMLGASFAQGNIEAGYLTENGSIRDFKRLETFLMVRENENFYFYIYIFFFFFFVV